MDHINCGFTDDIICPYCGYRFEDSWEFNNGDECVDDVVCHSCEKTFDLVVDYSVTYSTYKKE